MNITTTEITAIDHKFTKNWGKFPELVWLDQYCHLSFIIYLIGQFILGLAISYAYPNLDTSGLAFVLLGGIFSIVLLYHKKH
jgi:stearoyl-CoA desaturase (delta-9 desaturase)